MESLYLSDGTREKSGVERVSQVVIAAHKAGIALPWHTAQVIQLAGRNILEAVQIYVRSQAPGVASQTFRQPLRLLPFSPPPLPPRKSGDRSSGGGVAHGACDCYSESDPSIPTLHLAGEGGFRTRGLRPTVGVPTIHMADPIWRPQTSSLRTSQAS